MIKILVVVERLNFGICCECEVIMEEEERKKYKSFEVDLVYKLWILMWEDRTSSEEKEKTVASA